MKIRIKIIKCHAVPLLWICVLHVITPAYCKDRINKCCPRGQRMDIQLNCVLNEGTARSGNGIISEGNISNDDFSSWFPLNSVVNATTLKIHEHRRDRYLTLLKEDFEVDYGRMPDCVPKDSKCVSFFLDNYLENYNFILYENKTMRLHVSKRGSFHGYDEGIWEFERVKSDEEINMTLPWSSKDFLRTFPLEDACVDLLESDLYILVFCPCRTMTCIRKCCPENKFYDATAGKCDINEDHPVLEKSWRPLMDDASRQYYLMSDTFPSCDNPLLLKMSDHAYSTCNRFNKDSDNEFTIFKNGSLKVKKYKNLFQPHEYCGEVTWHDNGKIYEQNLILCSALKQNRTKLTSVRTFVYGGLLIIGGFCLLITVSVSIYLPELRRRIHNKIALSHNASLLVAYFALATTQISSDLGPKSCITLAIIIQFTFLASFFWLNVMCIDISMTFSSIKALGLSNVDVRKKYIIYNIYSWGSAVIISIVTIVMEFASNIPYDSLKPGLTCSCGFNTANASVLIYFHGPMSLLLIFNLVLFIFTTAKIVSVQRTTSILHKTDSNTTGGSSFQTDKQRYDPIQWLILYGKLFLLMGITWITEIISWAVGGPEYYWYFSDILNLLRAVFIFILFICKKSVYGSLKRKLLGKSKSRNKEGGSKSMSDALSVTTSLRESKGNTRSNSTSKKEAESQKLVSWKQAAEENCKNGGLEESNM